MNTDDPVAAIMELVADLSANGRAGHPWHEQIEAAIRALVDDRDHWRTVVERKGAFFDKWMAQLDICTGDPSEGCCLYHEAAAAHDEESAR
jgi:hypothetical protein